MSRFAPQLLLSLVLLFFGALAAEPLSAVSDEEEVGLVEVLVAEPFLADFTSELRIFRGDRYSSEEIEKAKKNLAELAEQMGFIDSKIESMTYRMGASRWGVQFEVELGEPVLLKALVIQGRTRLLPSDLSALIQMQKGERFDRRKMTRGIEKAKDQLFARNFWSASAQIEVTHYDPNRKEASAVIVLDAGPKYDVHVVGDTFFTAHEIKSRVTEKLRKTGLNERASDQVRYQLQGAYRKAGFKNVEVHLKEEEAPLRKRQADIARSLVVEIQEGTQALIEDVEIRGASYFGADQLRTQIKTFVSERVELPSFFGPVDARENEKERPVQLFNNNDAANARWLPYDERLLGQAKDEVLELYQNEGFLDVKIQGPRIVSEREGRWIRAAFVVDEGEQFLLGNVKIDSPLAPEMHLLSKERLQAQSPLRGLEIEQERVSLEQQLWNQGYPFARVEASVATGAEPRLVDVRYLVEPGAKVNIAEIQIAGNNVTRKDVVLGRLALKVGDWFSLEKLAESRTRLLQSDLFSKVDIYLDRAVGNVSPDRLRVDLQERPRTTVELGFGASLEQGPRVIGTVQHRNLFGLGLGLKARAQLNYPALFYRMPFFYSSQMIEALEHRFEKEEPWERVLLYTEGKALFGLEFPRIHWAPVETDASLDLTGVREIRPAFTLNRIGLQLGALVRFAPWLRLTPQVEVEYANFNCPVGYQIGLGCGDRSSGSTRRLDAGAVNQLTLRLISAIDRRDNALRPMSGYTLELSGDLGFGEAALLDQADAVVQWPIRYGKLVANAGFHAPLSRRLVLSLGARAGTIFGFGDETFVPLFKRFYLGGTSTIRGYAEDQILPADDGNWPADRASPRDQAKTSLSLGGNFFVLTRAELRFPLTTNLEGGVFIDAGELLIDLNQFSLTKLAVGAGFGVRYLTPIGPLLFDIGLRIFDGDRVFAPNFWNLFGIHFSIGYS